MFLDPQGSVAGWTDLQVDSVSDLPTAVLPVDGGPITSTFATGQNRMLTFTSTGGRMLLSVPDTNLVTSTQKITLTAPDGTVVLNAVSAPKGSKWVLETTIPGTYTLFFDPQGTVAGWTKLQVDSVADLPTTTLVVDGGAVSSTFTAGQNRTFTFSSTGGTLVLKVPDTTLGSSAQKVTLTAPDGTKTLNAVSASKGSSWTLTNTQVGTYTVFLDPTGTNAGTTSLSIGH